MRHLATALSLMALLGMSWSPAFANTGTTLPLHAIVTGFGPCPIPAPSGPDPCDQGTLVTNVPTGAGIAVYLLVRNYNELNGVQTAFEGAGWTFTFGTWDCQPGQLSATTPKGSLGPTDGTITTAFNQVTGGATVPIGRLHFANAASGCLTQVESTFPFGTHVIDGSQNVTAIMPDDRGSICVNQDGNDACMPTAEPVENATWGKIKAQYVR